MGQETDHRATAEGCLAKVWQGDLTPAETQRYLGLAQAHAALAQPAAPSTTNVADQAVWAAVEGALSRIDKMSGFFKEPDSVKSLVHAVRTLLAARENTTSS